MKYLSIEIASLRSPEYLGEEPLQRATWLNLLSYCVAQENRGVIEGCGDWKDRMWQQVCGITAEEAGTKSSLWRWEGANLIVLFYPHEAHDFPDRARKSGKAGGKAKAERVPKQPSSDPTSTPTSDPTSTPTRVALAPALPNVMKGNEMKGNEIITPLPPKGDEEEEVVVIGRDWAAEFNAFWAEYPESRKKNRYRVESAWSSQRHHLPPKNELQEALRAFKASPEWKREGGKFIPAPETWIMERRWQDAPAYSPKAKPAPKSEVDEADAFAWRREVYPESLEVHPTASTFPFSKWPDSIRAEYRNRNKQTQLQAA
jgi:hypothetical protein